MAFDGLVLAAVRAELTKTIIGGKIDRIFQPEKEEIFLHIRQPGQNLRLVLSAQAQDARVHLTAEAKANPISPPMFCMVLRKHLEGGRITKVEQPDFERILHIFIESPNELGDTTEKILICEIMGKHSNIILVQAADQVILDGIKRYTHAVSRHREVLPGRTYLAPPNQNKQNPLTIEEDDFRQLIWGGDLDCLLPAVLFQSLVGISPLSAQELVARAGLPLDRQLNQCGEYELNCLWQAIQWLKDTVAQNKFSPTTVETGGKTFFSAVELTHLDGPMARYQTVSQLLEKYFSAKYRQKRWRERYCRLVKIVDNELARCYKKRVRQEDSLTEVKDAENWRIAGELITTYLWQIKPGDAEVELPNFYDPEEKPFLVILDPLLSAAENAQQYFRRYVKKRDSLQVVQEQLDKTLAEIDYLESVQSELEHAQTEEELDAIEQEMTEQNYLKVKPVKGRHKPSKPKEAVLEPRAYISSDGWEILVGRNNKQNDWLTLRLAMKEDWWFHTKDIPGSHVIVRMPAGQEIPPDRTVEEAAALAAYFSRAKTSSTVPVDYTQRKNVRKPNGAPPGRVIYDHQWTVYVNPDEELVKQLAKS